MFRSFGVVLASVALLHCVGDEPDGASASGNDGGTADGGASGDGASDVGSASLALDVAKTWIHRNETVPLAFDVSRVGNPGALVVRAVGLPGGVTAADVTVDATNKGSLELKAATDTTIVAKTEVSIELVAGTKVLDKKTLVVRIAGAAGDADTGFGTSGVATVTMRDPAGGSGNGSAWPESMAIYPQSLGANAGKIAVVGRVTTAADQSGRRYVFVARFNTDGTVDTTFGEPTSTGKSGYRILDIVFYEGGGTSLAVDSLGRIAIYGTGLSNTVSLSRVTSDGSLDTSFKSYSGNLPAEYYFGYARSVVALPVDKLLVTGEFNQPDPGGSIHPTFGTFTVEGDLDTTWAQSGRDNLPSIRSGDSSTDPVITKVDGTGRFVFAGRACNGGWKAAASSCKSIVGRLTALGAYDTTFGDSAGSTRKGVTEVGFGGALGSTGTEEQFQGLVIDAAGNAIAVGHTNNYARGTIARFNVNDGTPDTSFASTGSQTVELVGTSQTLNSVGIDSHGRILAVGNSSDGALVINRVRFDSTGKRDTAFAPTLVHASSNSVYGAVDADDELVVVSSTYRSGSQPPTDLAVRRFWP
jgi:uncharacterized delta-60 repeat protein